MLLEKTKTNEIRSSYPKNQRLTKMKFLLIVLLLLQFLLLHQKRIKQIILITKENGKPQAQELPISKIPVVSAISGFMNILRVYTPQKNRKKVEIAAKSILGDLK